MPLVYTYVDFLLEGAEDNTPAPMETDDVAGASAKPGQKKVRVIYVLLLLRFMMIFI